MSEEAKAEGVQNAPEPEAPAPEPVQAEAAPEKPEPAPKQEAKPEPKDDKSSQDLSFFVQRIGELETEKKELAATIAEMKAAEEERKAEALQREVEAKGKARTELLQGEWGIVKADYMRLAPSVEEADPTTEQGRESLRQWVNANPGLFNKAPELPNSDTPKQPSQGIFSARAWTWADKFRE